MSDLAVRAQFVLSEAFLGLRRNLNLTLAVVVTVSVSLGLFGAGLMMRAQVSQMKDYWYSRVEVSVFLDNGITDAERTAVHDRLAALPQTQTVYYESKQQAYQRFSRQFKDSPDLVKNVTPDALPESFRVKLHDPAQYTQVAQVAQTLPGVNEVVDQRQILDRFFRVLHGFQTAALVIALVQLLVAVTLIANTIRVAAHTRRRETHVMRLVGASKLFIAAPFMLEGVAAGALGAAVASGLLVAIQHFFVNEQLRPVFQFTAFIGWGSVLQIVPVLFATGVALCAAVSAVVIRRHVEV